MNIGDIIKGYINGTLVALTLDDRVLADPSMHQYEKGYWATTNTGNEYFISDSGDIYSNSTAYPDVFDMQVGRLSSIKKINF